MGRLRVSNWEDHAHRGMELKPTSDAIYGKRVKPRVYLFHRWAEEQGKVIVQQKGTSKKTTVSNDDLELN